MLSSYNELKFRAHKKRLLDELKRKGITDSAVLKAVSSINRHEFVDSALASRAYEDTALPIDMGQTISQPYTVAFQTQLLEVEKGSKILEIGTGSGYQCAVLLELGASVYTIERHRFLYNRAKDLLQKLGYRAEFKCGDGTEGWSAYAPYDGIVVTAGAPVVPAALMEQLSVGGRLVIPVGNDERQAMHRITCIGDNEFEEEVFDDFKFVPLIGRDGW